MCGRCLREAADIEFCAPIVKKEKKRVRRKQASANISTTSTAITPSPLLPLSSSSTPRFISSSSSLRDWHCIYFTDDLSAAVSITRKVLLPLNQSRHSLFRDFTAAAAAAAVTVPAPLSSVNNNGLGNRKWEPSSSLLDGSSDDVSLVVFFDGQHASHLLEAIARIQTVRPRIRRVAVAFFSPSSERTQPLPPPPPPLDSSSLSLPWASDRCSFLYVHLMGYEGKGMLRKTKDFASLWACHVEWWTTSSPPAADPLLFSRYQLFISQ